MKSSVQYTAAALELPVMHVLQTASVLACSWLPWAAEYLLLWHGSWPHYCAELCCPLCQTLQATDGLQN